MPSDAVETIRYTGDDGRIGHAEITIAGATVMLSDEYPELEVVSPTTLGGTRRRCTSKWPDVDAVYDRVVAAGARVPAPPKDEAYGARSFTMIDPFGHRWMIQTPTGEMQDQVEGYTITRAETDRREAATASSAASASCSVPSLMTASSAAPIPWSPIAPCR